MPYKNYYAVFFVLLRLLLAWSCSAFFDHLLVALEHVAAAVLRGAVLVQDYCSDLAILEELKELMQTWGRFVPL